MPKSWRRRTDGLLLIDVGGHLIINLKKQLRVLWIHGKMDNVPDILHGAVGKKGQLRITDPIGNSLPFQQINKRS